MKKINVLIVAGNMDVGGIENQLMHLVRNADKDRFHFAFTSNMPDAHYRKEIEMLGCDFIELPFECRRNPVKYCRFMFKTMRNGYYDVVHAHELFHSGVTIFLAWLAGVSSRISHAHTWREGKTGQEKKTILRRIYYRVMRMILLNCSTQLIACSSWAGKYLFGENATRKENYHLIYNSVVTERFLSNDDNPDENVDPDRINLLHVGRFDPVKNQLFLVSIAEILKQNETKIRILCVGAGDSLYAEVVQQEIVNKNLSDYIELLGVRDDISTLLHKTRVFLLPSAYEGMPLVLIEAQCAGIPCVVADTFSHEVDFGLDMITWLEPNATAEHWYKEILKAIAKQRIASDDIRKAIKEGGFDSSIFAKKVCDLYEADLEEIRGSFRSAMARA